MARGCSSPHSGRRRPSGLPRSSRTTSRLLYSSWSPPAVLAWLNTLPCRRSLLGRPRLSRLKKEALRKEPFRQVSMGPRELADQPVPYKPSSRVARDYLVPVGAVNDKNWGDNTCGLPAEASGFLLSTAQASILDGRGEQSGVSSWQQKFPRGTGVAWLHDRAVEKNPQEEEVALTGAGVRVALGVSDMDLLRWAGWVKVVHIPSPVLAPHSPQLSFPLWPLHLSSEAPQL